MLFCIFAKYSIASSIFYPSNKFDRQITNKLRSPVRCSSTIFNNGNQFPRLARHPGHHREPRKRWLLVGSFTLPTSLASHGSGTVNGTMEAYKRDRKTTVPSSCLPATISLLYLRHFLLESCIWTLQGETELCVTFLWFKFTCSGC